MSLSQSFGERLDPFSPQRELQPSNSNCKLSHPSRVVKPAPLDLSAQTPRTPWSRLEDDATAKTKDTPSVTGEECLQKSDILAYLSLVDKLGHVDLDERDSERSNSAQTSSEHDIETEETPQDQNEEVVQTMTPAIISMSRKSGQNTIIPRITRNSSDYKTPSSQDESMLPKGETSPTSPSFLNRGFGSFRRKSSTYSHDGSSRSSIDSYSTMRSSKRGSRDAKGGWLSQIKEWTTAAEPSSQALKQHRCETFAKAGIAPDDPRAKAKLNLPTTTLPPEALKPAGKPLKPEEILKSHSEEKKRNRWSVASSSLSQASWSSMSQFSSSSSLGLAPSSRGDR